MAAGDGLRKTFTVQEFTRRIGSSAITVVSHEEARILRDNPDFQPVYTYGLDSPQIFAGEIGRYHGVRVVVGAVAVTEMIEELGKSQSAAEGWVRKREADWVREYEASFSQAVS